MYGLFLVVSNKDNDYSFGNDGLRLINIIRVDERAKNNLVRVLGLDEKADKNLVLIVIRDHNPKLIRMSIDTRIEEINHNFFEVRMLKHIQFGTLNNNQFSQYMAIIFGVNGVRLQLNDLLDDHIIVDQDWNSLEELFTVLNSVPQLKYVVLRGWNELLGEIENIQDIDFLVNDWVLFSKLIRLRPNKYKPYKGYIVLKDSRVSIDIRFLGDGYFDSNWQNNVLVSRQHTHFFFIPDEENYLFSLLYHKLIHKKGQSTKYEFEMKLLSANYKVAPSELIYLLAAYMNTNHYNISRCIDQSVENSINLKMERKLQLMLMPFMHKPLEQIAKEQFYHFVPKNVVKLLKKIVK